MNILVLNSGSSSLKYQVIDMKKEKPIIIGHIDGINLIRCKLKYSANNKTITRNIHVKNHTQALELAIESIKQIMDIAEIKAIGHRVVHGGEIYKDAIKITQKVVKTINKLNELAPLHNSANLDGIKACEKIFPNIPQVAVFDTAFHQTIPKKAYLYGIPLEYYNKYKIRKYGFHGTSHKYVMLKAKELLKKRKVNLITCHLGNGSSITAIQDNLSIDTSMGFTPLQGIIMGTRSGSIDPAIVGFLSKKLKKSPNNIIDILNNKSGLFAICGHSDVRTIHEHAIKGDEKCQLALEILSDNIASYIAKYITIINKKVDAIIFTAGIGEEAYFVREMICDKLKTLGVKLDTAKNKRNSKIISAKGSKYKLLVIPTKEELMIAKEVVDVLGLK